MELNEKNIIREGKAHYIRKKGKGYYEVLKNGITRSTVVATIHYSNDEKKALEIAISEFNNRELQYKDN